MESKNIQRVTFAELSDAKSVMVLVQADIEHKWSAYRTMVSMGVRPNSGAMAEARKDIVETLQLMLAVTDEFQRLHTDCPCPTTNEEIEEGKSRLREALDRVNQEAAEAGPVDNDPAHAIEDLQKFLGATGFPVPEGFDRMDVPGLSTGNDGTGMYL